MGAGSDFGCGSGFFRNRITGQYTASPHIASGGILADEMGLGKTLSVIALICWSLDQTVAPQAASAPIPSLRPTLIVAPKSTTHVWDTQIQRHVLADQLRVAVYHGASRKGLGVCKLQTLDAVITTYDTLKSDWSSQGPLYSMPWHRLVLDEAHQIRNRASKVFEATCAVDAHSRWCLTGTPVQNSLDDYGALLSFLRIPGVSTKPEFDRLISTPLVKQDSSTAIARLQCLVQATCLRRTPDLIEGHLRLPEPVSRLEELSLEPSDQQIYGFFRRQGLFWMSLISETEAAGGSKRLSAGALQMINNLRQICNHGEEMLSAEARWAWERKEDQQWAIDWDELGDRCIKCRGSAAILSGQAPLSLGSGGPLQLPDELCEDCSGQQDAPGTNIRGRGESARKSSAKLDALVCNLLLESCPNGADDPRELDKSVVFSCWTRILDLVQSRLEAEGLRFVRIDGQTSLSGRNDAMKLFREVAGCTVMLASLGSVKEGVDLTAANHVHLLEP